MAQRPLFSVPKGVLCALAAALALQLGWHHGQRAAPQARALPPAPPPALLQLASLGEPLALSKALMLYLQAYDDQPGISLSLRRLDYRRVQDWLDAALTLDPRSQYPLLAASEVYAAVDDPQRVRRMLEFVYARFEEDPQRRWPWLAHAALAARHRLHDLPLARKYAQALRRRAGPGAPAWTRELEVFILEDMNELEAARTLIGALLAGGQVSDPHELAFLAARLDALAARAPAAH